MTDTTTRATLRGNFRSPRNAFQNAAGSIHNDAVASKLGFKGGTVPGSVHMDQFVPMLLERYGERWFNTGDISLYFTQAVTDGELVRAFVEPQADRARLSMRNAQDAMICVGTASAGAPDTNSELAERLRRADHGPMSLRILEAFEVGETRTGIPLRLDEGKHASTLERITEPLPIYLDGVLPPSEVISLTHQVRPVVLDKVNRSVGLFGALEIQHLRGPLRAGVDYVARTRILKLDESPRSEIVWYEVIAAPAGKTADVARAIYSIRFMKASSPLWSETAE
jgi:hypothetical protein